MARAQIKSCGPTRGRQKTKKIGMGSGKWIAKARNEKRGTVKKRSS
jgi:hypothetical protein